MGSLRRLLWCQPLFLFAALAAMPAGCGGDSSADGGGPGSGGTGGIAASGGTGATGGASGGAGGATGGAAGSVPTGGQAGADAAVGTDAPPDSPPDANPVCNTTPMSATVTAHLRITADNECEVFVNGTSVGTTNNWGAAVTIDVSLFVHPAVKNVVAVRGTNTSSQDGNDRGIIGELTINAGDAGDAGVAALVLTDAAWRSSKTEETGWTGLAFDDSKWSAATEIADHGAAPWGPILTTTGAKWIWSAPVPASTANKPNLETAYVRRTFYFTVDGSTIGNQPGCP